MKLSEKILALRKQRGMSQEDLAEKLNVSRQAVSRWEMGSTLPDASNVLHLSKLFGVTADYLLNDDRESGQVAPAATSAQPAARAKRKRAAGLVMAGVGLLGNFTIYVLSRAIEVKVPRVTYDASGEKLYHWSYEWTGYSYKYFILEHHLELLTALFWVLLFAGLAAAFVRKDRLRAGLGGLKGGTRRGKKPV